ncbi:hypothetical protein FVE85_6019 [Porphyridium purpureum]|uniref:Uncharacterized protein n=1 Tax=Porphyridium purpureum TaxID=35688 RepID=A0A5J4Z616_PORPP|nr:hypothetical protein FVE85_6019 [Porphyridium purpureum]|eukprot:POR6628..scf295_1
MEGTRHALCESDAALAPCTTRCWKSRSAWLCFGLVAWPTDGGLSVGLRSAAQGSRRVCLARQVERKAKQFATAARVGLRMATWGVSDKDVSDQDYQDGWAVRQDGAQNRGVHQRQKNGRQTRPSNMPAQKVGQRQAWDPASRKPSRDDRSNTMKTGATKYKARDARMQPRRPPQSQQQKQPDAWSAYDDNDYEDEEEDEESDDDWYDDADDIIVAQDGEPGTRGRMERAGTNDFGGREISTAGRYGHESRTSRALGSGRRSQSQSQGAPGRISKRIGQSVDTSRTQGRRRPSPLSGIDPNEGKWSYRDVFQSASSSSQPDIAGSGSDSSAKASKTSSLAKRKPIRALDLIQSQDRLEFLQREATRQEKAKAFEERRAAREQREKAWQAERDRQRAERARTSQSGTSRRPGEVYAQLAEQSESGFTRINDAETRKQVREAASKPVRNERPQEVSTSTGPALSTSSLPKEGESDSEWTDSDSTSNQDPNRDGNEDSSSAIASTNAYMLDSFNYGESPRAIQKATELMRRRTGASSPVRKQSERNRFKTLAFNGSAGAATSGDTGTGKHDGTSEGMQEQAGEAKATKKMTLDTGEQEVIEYEVYNGVTYMRNVDFEALRAERERAAATTGSDENMFSPFKDDSKESSSTPGWERKSPRGSYNKQLTRQGQKQGDPTRGNQNESKASTRQRRPQKYERPQGGRRGAGFNGDDEVDAMLDWDEPIGSRRRRGVSGTFEYTQKRQPASDTKGEGSRPFRTRDDIVESNNPEDFL